MTLPPADYQPTEPAPLMPVANAATTRLPSAARIRAGREIRRVLDAGHEHQSAVLIVKVLDSPTGLTRLGLVVSRKHGNAVKRNRIKRLLRAAFRQLRATLPGPRDYVIIPRRERSARLSLAEATGALAEAAQALAEATTPLPDRQT